MSDEDDSGMDELARVFNARQKHLIECERLLALALECLRAAPTCTGTLACLEPFDGGHKCEHYRALRARVMEGK